MTRVAVAGSGAWGTALALSIAHKGGHQVTLWSHTREAAEILEAARENTAYLPGISLPPELKITSDDRAVIEGNDLILSAVPSEHLRATWHRLSPYLSPGQAIISATKGVEPGSFLRMSQVIGQVLAAERRAEGIEIGVVSGPSFAREVATGVPTALTVASKSPELATLVQQAFSSPNLRLYTNDDMIGVELGGALKNVIAIASGVSAGLGLGYNAAAALITRGIAEITRMAVACGGRGETLAGLSGIGDVVLTATGSLSRNRTVGYQLGQGHRLAEILAHLDGKVAEGIRTTRAAVGLARELNIEMPICEQMKLILDEDKPPLQAMHDLMTRPGRDE